MPQRSTPPSWNEHLLRPDGSCPVRSGLVCLVGLGRGVAEHLVTIRSVAETLAIDQVPAH